MRKPYITLNVVLTWDGSLCAFHALIGSEFTGNATRGFGVKEFVDHDLVWPKDQRTLFGDHTPEEKAQCRRMKNRIKKLKDGLENAHKSLPGGWYATTPSKEYVEHLGQAGFKVGDTNLPGSTVSQYATFLCGPIEVTDGNDIIEQLENLLAILNPKFNTAYYCKTTACCKCAIL